ncbi:hypothetical protein Tdes44962_MAKER04102 [Teratosphaeria destructans]|uniref:BTB domain-containing protein n=1 Tax=Teratosphaeria destructans TaxID=418781 RepID=A0A9W7W0R3_9PEZI|nr:hypothetical protein Tdes44962_MAKER04102 [Teratosphaeria destructans]
MTWQTRGQTFWDVDEYNPPPKRHVVASTDTDESLSLHERLVHDDTFMFARAKGNATISFPGEDGIVSCFNDIDSAVFYERCPLLAAAFELSSGGVKLHLERLSPSTALPFLRYMYTGTYVSARVDGEDPKDVPSSILLHAQLYELGDLYDIPDLKSQAYVNILRQCEFGCSSPDPPIELCAAIRYIYRHLRGHKDLLDLVVNYCVTNFLRHRLAHDEEFQNLPAQFHQLLCEICMHHDINNDVACAIVQLPCQDKTPRVIRKNACEMDVVYRFHGAMDDDLPKKRQRIQPPERVSNLSLALKSRDPFADPTTDESESDVDDFYLVSKRRKSLELHATEIPASDVPSSDNGFQTKASSPAATGASESDWDIDMFVEIARSEAGSKRQIAGLPARTRPFSTGVVEADTEGSDSEWSCL